MLAHGTPRLRLAGAFGVLAVLGGCVAQALASGIAPAAPEPTCMKMVETKAPISWRRMAEARDTLRLNGWCSAVGEPVIGGPAAGAQDGATVLDSLVVVTWNIHVGGGDIVRLVGDLRGGARTAGRPVGDFVLLLQEAHRAGPDVPAHAPAGFYPPRILERQPSGERLDIVQVAEALGLYFVYVPSMRNGMGGDPAEDRGNAILSTLPLNDLEAIELPYESERRVAVGATVHAVGPDGVARSLRVVAAHLDNRSARDRFIGTFGSGRTRQARALAAAVEDHAVVVGADLNSWNAGFLESAVPLLHASFPDSPPTSVPTFPVARGLISRKLDHWLARLPEGWSASVRRIDDRYGSDHYPLIGTVDWTGRAKPTVGAEPMLTVANGSGR
jgi:endonuclease/exonuclease/phosphatase family metal-dependent hydrolase